MSAERGHWAVIDSDGIEVEGYGSVEEADLAVDELNGPLGPSIDAEYDYKWVSE